MTNLKKTKLIILFSVMIDIIGFGVVIPVLPFYVETFGVSAKVITLLFAVYAFFSFFSAPFLGSLSDRFGRKPIFLASVISTSIGWFVFAGARSIPVLFLGRIIDGIAAGNVSTAQSYLVDISRDDKERTTNLGLIGAVLGIGFIIGPLIGGFLSSIYLTLPFWFTGFLAFGNAILGYFILPETNLNRNKEKRIYLNPFRPVARAARSIKLRRCYLAWFLFLLAVSIMHSVFSLYIGSAFGYGALESGLFLAGMGIIIAFNQGIALKRFWLERFREPDIVFWGFLASFLGFLVVSIKNPAIFVGGVVVLAFSQAILRVVMTSQITAQAEADSRGEILGTLTSISSLSMIVGPAISGWAFDFKDNLPFLLSAFVIFAGFLALHWKQTGQNH